MGKFELAIELGNDAMQDAVDIAAALMKVAKRVGETGRFEREGIIQDTNGNRVGYWKMRPDEDTQPS